MMPIHKETDNGKLYFGNKDIDYLKKVSRQAIEDHHNISILYFEVDYNLSKSDFYGQLLIKKFKNPKGLELKGAYKIEQDSNISFQGIPNKSLKLSVFLYTDLLKELFVEPKLGDYFGIGKRLYLIVDKTTNDVGPGSIFVKRGRVTIDYKCIEETDEALLENPFGESNYSEENINPQNFS